MLTISEIYASLQGEGRLTGTPSVLIRTSGCNLRCTFCDTPFTSWEPTGVPMTVEQVVAETVRHGLAHVIVTGGEPMIAAELGPLCASLAAEGLHITIETAGTRDRNVVCDLMSISPKLANSDPIPSRSARWAKLHPARRHRPDVVARLVTRYDTQLKYVVDQPSDLADVETSLAEIVAAANVITPPAVTVASTALETESYRAIDGRHGDSDKARPAITRQSLDERVWLMPQGVEQTSLREREAWLAPLCRERGWTFCRRKHIEWFGHTRRT